MSKKTPEKQTESTFLPEFGAPADNGVKRANNGPMDILLFPDGGMCIELTRNKYVSATSYLLCVRAYTNNAEWAAYIDEQATAREISRQAKKSGPTKGKGKGHVYYYADDDGKKHGPYTEADFDTVIDNGHVDRETLVFHSAMVQPAWAEAATDAQVLSMLNRVPPPLPALARE